MSVLTVLTKANLFTSLDDPTNSQHLTMQSVKIPMLTERTMSHTPGGGAMSIEIGMRQIEALTMTFKLKGVNQDVMRQFGINAQSRRKYTVRGSMLNVRDQTELPLIAVVEGRLIKVDMSEFSAENGVDSDYEIKEIVHYELTIAGTEKYYFNFFEGLLGFRIDGVATFGDAARNLGLV